MSGLAVDLDEYEGASSSTADLLRARSWLPQATEAPVAITRMKEHEIARVAKDGVLLTY